MTSYAGIGARSSPEHILQLIREAAARFAERGFVLRTGGAPGADRAFFEGAQSVGGRIDLYLPWPTFWTPPSFAGVEIQTYPSRDAYKLAERHHPNWTNLKRSVRSLHARNAHVVLGQYLNEPAKFILCWTPDGSGGGGTGQALRMAPYYSIPVLDLGRPDELERLRTWLGGNAALRTQDATREKYGGVRDGSHDLPAGDAVRANS